MKAWRQAYGEVNHESILGRNYCCHLSESLIALLIKTRFYSTVKFVQVFELSDWT